MDKLPDDPKQIEAMARLALAKAKADRARAAMDGSSSSSAAGAGGSSGGSAKSTFMMTQEEERRLMEGFKDAKFIEDFKELLRDMSDPKHRAEQEAYLEQMERGEQVPSNMRLLRPNPGFALKTKLTDRRAKPSTTTTEGDAEAKVFINVTTSDEIEPPSFKSVKERSFMLPNICGPPRYENDAKGKPTLTFDVVVHPQALVIAGLLPESAVAEPAAAVLNSAPITASSPSLASLSADERASRIADDKEARERAKADMTMLQIMSRFGSASQYKAILHEVAVEQAERSYRNGLAKAKGGPGGAVSAETAAEIAKVTFDKKGAAVLKNCKCVGGKPALLNIPLGGGNDNLRKPIGPSAASSSSGGGALARAGNTVAKGMNERDPAASKASHAADPILAPPAPSSSTSSSTAATKTAAVAAQPIAALGAKHATVVKGGGRLGASTASAASTSESLLTATKTTAITASARKAEASRAPDRFPVRFEEEGEVGVLIPRVETVHRGGVIDISRSLSFTSATGSGAGSESGETGENPLALAGAGRPKELVLRIHLPLLPGGASIEHCDIQRADSDISTGAAASAEADVLELRSAVVPFKRLSSEDDDDSASTPAEPLPCERCRYRLSYRLPFPMDHDGIANGRIPPLKAKFEKDKKLLTLTVPVAPAPLTVPSATTPLALGQSSASSSSGGPLIEALPDPPAAPETAADTEAKGKEAKKPQPQPEAQHSRWVKERAVAVNPPAQPTQPPQPLAQQVAAPAPAPAPAAASVPTPAAAPQPEPKQAAEPVATKQPTQSAQPPAAAETADDRAGRYHVVYGGEAPFRWRQDDDCVALIIDCPHVTPETVRVAYRRDRKRLPGVITRCAPSASNSASNAKPTEAEAVIVANGIEVTFEAAVSSVDLARYSAAIAKEQGPLANGSSSPVVPRTDAPGYTLDSKLYPGAAADMASSSTGPAKAVVFSYCVDLPLLCGEVDASRTEVDASDLNLAIVLHKRAGKQWAGLVDEGLLEQAEEESRRLEELEAAQEDQEDAHQAQTKAEATAEPVKETQQPAESPAPAPAAAAVPADPLSQESLQRFLPADVAAALSRGKAELPAFLRPLQEHIQSGKPLPKPAGQVAQKTWSDVALTSPFLVRGASTASNNAANDAKEKAGKLVRGASGALYDAEAVYRALMREVVQLPTTQQPGGK